MPSLNTFALIRWQVNWDGGTPTVAPADGFPTIARLLLPDGVTSTDSQVIAQYLLSIPDQEERQTATQAMADGLITVVPVLKAAVVAPPVPPRVRAAGPPAALAQRENTRRNVASTS